MAVLKHTYSPPFRGHHEVFGLLICKIDEAEQAVSTIEILYTTTTSTGELTLLQLASQGFSSYPDLPSV